MKQTIELPDYLASEEIVKGWCERLQINFKGKKKGNFIIQFDDPLSIFWLGANLGAGLLPPSMQTKQGNSEYIKRFLNQEKQFTAGFNSPKTIMEEMDMY